MYLWRAVDSEGEVLDILVQSRRNKKAALKLMRKLLKKQGYALNKVVTDKLPSYGAALRDLNMTGKHVTGGRSNNRAENSHLPVRQRERRMQGFKSSGSAQRFLSTHAAMREYGESRTKMAQVRKLAGALGLGHFGTGDAVMRRQGRAVERPYTLVELAAMNDAFSTLGETTFEVYLNAGAFWRNVPAEVWTYKLGGYQVLKKWLSYRERNVSGRSLRPDEVHHFTDTARRIGAIYSSVKFTDSRLLSAFFHEVSH